MIYVLLIILSTFIVFAYFITNKDILSAWFISNLVFALSTIVVIANQRNWGFDLNSKTFFVIVLAMICLGLGELFVRWLFSKRVINVHTKSTTKIVSVNPLHYYDYEMNIPFLYTNFISIAMSIYVFIYYNKVKQIASIIGNVEDFASSLKYYNLYGSAGYSVGTLYTFGFIVCNVLAYYYIYIVLYKMIFSKFKKRDMWNLIPIIIFCIMQIITASRSNFIYIITAAIVIGYILWKSKYEWKRNYNGKIIRIAIIAIIGFFTIFYYSGKLTGKSQHFANAFEGISVYSGGSIVALNSFVETFTFDQSDFGSETLYGISHILSRVGGKEIIETRHLEFTPINSYLRTNIYTSLRRYLHDYGYVGMCFMQFMIGVFYTIIYLNIKRHAYKNEILAILIYSSIFYPIVMQSIDEKFLTIMITPTMLIQILCFYIFYKILVSKPNRAINYYDLK